jgi:Protein of unknown function (DUF2934)
MTRNTESSAFIVVSAGDIAERAYAIYVERGCGDGFDREDWLRAERELKAASSNALRKGSTNGGNTAQHRQP